MLERLEVVDEEPDDGLIKVLVRRERISEIRLKRGKLGGTIILSEFVSAGARQKIKELLDQVALQSGIVISSLVARDTNEGKLTRYEKEILRISRMLAEISNQVSSVKMAGVNHKVSCVKMVEARVAALNAIRDLQTDPHLPEVYLGSVNALDEDWQKVCSPQNC